MKRRAAIVAAVALLWLGLEGAALVFGSNALHALALAAGLALLMATGWLLWTAERDRRRWQDTLDAMEAGIVLYDERDRVLLANRDFRRLYRLADGEVTQGMPFEALLRSRVERGLVPEAQGREEAWIAERVAQHRETPGRSFLREMVDGRWRRIIEQRLPDGTRLGFSLDVTELVENQRALDAARRDAERTHRLLTTAIEALPAAIEVYDANDRLVLFNQRMLQIYPHMRGQPTLLGETFDTLVRRALAAGRVPEAIGREQEWLRERLATRGRHAEPRLQRGPDGRWHHIYETPMDGGGLVAVRLDASDIVARRDELMAAHERAARDHALLGDAVAALPEGFALFDADDRLVLCNERFRALYRDSAPAIVTGASFESILRYGLERGQYPQAEADPQGWLAERLRRHREPDGVPILEALADGRWMRIDERRTAGGGVAGVRTDVSEMVRTNEELEASRRAAEDAAVALRHANEQLERLSTTDALTGLTNRRGFDTRLAEEVQRAMRHGTPLALLIADIDHFKLYNDTHGHPQGDRALQAVAAVLARAVRRPAETAVRIGGEEFALLLPHADASAARTVAERCGQAMATLALSHPRSPTAPHITLSIGAAVLDTLRREDAASLLRRADAALYAVKAAGRAHCIVAEDTDG